MTGNDAIETQCTNCGARVRVPKPGTYRCPKCQGVFTLEPPDEPSTPAPEPAGIPLVEPAGTAPADDNTYRLVSEESDAEPAPACTNHPDRPAVAVCQVCGNFVCPECYGMRDGRIVCTRCGTPKPYVGYQPGYGPPPPPTGIPYEAGGASEAIGGFFRAIGGAMFRPREFFARMWPQQKLLRALLFGVLIKTVVTLNQMIVAWIEIRSPEFSESLAELQGMLPAELAPVFDQVIDSFLNSNTWLIASAITSPISAAMSVLLMAVVVHLFLAMFGGAKAGIEATIKVTAYSYAAQLFALIPICGSWVGFIWQIVILSIGLGVVHRTTTGRAAAAALAPLAILFVFVLFAIVIGVALGISAFG